MLRLRYFHPLVDRALRGAWPAILLGLAAAGAGWQPAPLLAQSAADRFERLVREADGAWQAGRFPAAKAGYAEALALDSVGSTRAIYRLAVLHSWDGDLAGAIRLFRRYSRLEPQDEEGRIALGKAYAWNGQTDQAVAVYDSILARDRTYRDAALGAALALAWAGRFELAVGRYDRWLLVSPKDVEAELSRARTLAWWGKLARAERTYAEIARRGERLEGYKGVALVAAWRGDLGRSERLWRDVVRRAPKDAEGWVGLAQVLRWSGRPDQARGALNRALSADPKNADAAAQLRWVRGDLRPALDPSLTVSWDSDRNRSVLAAAGWSFRPFRGGRLTMAGSRREAELGSSTGTSTSGRAVLRLNFAAVTLTADGGVTQTEGDGIARRTVALAGGAATARIGSPLTLGFGVRKSVFDETVSLLGSGIDVRSVTGDAELRLAARWALSGGAERASLRGGSGPNTREAANAALRWRVRRPLTVSLAGRAFRYERNAHDGYFAPSTYRLGEAVVRWAPGRDLGWNGVIEGALGGQRVVATPGGTPTTSATQRITVGLGYRPKPGAEVVAEFGYSNVSAPAGGAVGGSIYHSQVAGLRVRLLF